MLDHRGTPERPGRVVTLTQDDTAVTWGRAFEIAGTHEEQEQTLKYLEWREKQYDIRERVDVHSPFALNAFQKDGDVTEYPHQSELLNHPDRVAVESCLVYIAGNDPTSNPNFLGPAPLDDVALQIATNSGPSGHNRDYLFGLAGAMREMGVNDKELFDLELMVLQQIKVLGRIKP